MIPTSLLSHFGSVTSICRRQQFSKLTAMLLSGSLILQSATAVAPEWWTTQHVLTSNVAADDFALANVGQLKTIAQKAAQQMDQAFPARSGPVITSLVQSWLNQNSSIVRDDYAVVTVGEVKSVAKLFYDRLGLSYPWAGSNLAIDDFAAANIGQLKTAFAFPIANSYIGGPDDDYDHDGLTNSQELALGTNPELRDSDGDGVPDGLEMSEGTAPMDTSSSSAALIVLTFRSPIE